jgi:hypothetical protein
MPARPERIKIGVAILAERRVPSTSKPDMSGRFRSNLHAVLYGLISAALERPEGAPLAEQDQLRIPVVDAPLPTMVALPMFLNIERS